MISIGSAVIYTQDSESVCVVFEASNLGTHLAELALENGQMCCS
jgi:hypothetical protein